VRRLDLMVQNELAHDHVAQDAWKQARRVEGRGPKDTAAAVQPVADPTATVSPPQAA
jgi:hypothetical protein